MQMYDTEKSYVEALKNLVTVKFFLFEKRFLEEIICIF
jgi:hypothetical protein